MGSKGFAWPVLSRVEGLSPNGGLLPLTLSLSKGHPELLEGPVLSLSKGATPTLTDIPATPA
jgi:hypothetical protein